MSGTKISKKSPPFTAQSLPLKERVFHAIAALRKVHQMLQDLAEQDLWYQSGKRSKPSAELGRFNGTGEKEARLEAMWRDAVEFEVGVFGEEAVRAALFDLRKEAHRGH